MPGDDGIEPVLDADETFRNAKDGILGADDKAAIAALVHAAELLQGSKEGHAPFEMFFTVCEEKGLVGAKHLRRDQLLSPLAVVLDGAGAVGSIVVAAPSQKIIKARFKGQAAHAGEDPERGRNAVLAAAKAVAAMSLGRLDEETTANIGVIRGGDATNVVPELCEIEGECRSHDDGRLVEVAGEMVDLIQEAAAEVGVDVETTLVHEFTAFSLEPESAVVELVQRAISAAGLAPLLHKAGGGCDANILNEWGLPAVNLSTGMTHVHSADESLTLDELERLCGVVLWAITLAGEDVESQGAEVL
jgi:tripeptide aminopeptidase